MKHINVKQTQIKFWIGLFVMIVYANSAFTQVTIDNGDLYFKKSKPIPLRKWSWNIGLLFQ